MVGVEEQSPDTIGKATMHTEYDSNRDFKSPFAAARENQSIDGFEQKSVRSNATNSKNFIQANQQVKTSNILN